MVGKEAVLIDVGAWGRGPERACEAVNVLWLPRLLPLLQKAALGSKPNFPITTSITSVTLARESEDKGVCFASGLISTLTVHCSYWKLPHGVYEK